MKQTVILSGILADRHQRFTNTAIHPFSTNVPLLYPQKTFENLSFFIFSGGGI